MVTGCAHVETRVEQDNLPKIPALFANHSGGIVLEPTEAEVADALELGRREQEHPGLVRKVYLWKTDANDLSSESLYIIVRTPLYLIARHSLEQTRAGRAPNPKFITFARHFGFVRLSVSQQSIDLAAYKKYALEMELSLFRDGAPVTPVSSIPAWNGVDPFSDPDDPLASWEATSWLKHGVEDMELKSLAQSEESVKRTPSVPGQKNPGAARVMLQPDDAVFPIAELLKDGRYEIVLRFRPGKATAGSNPEIRIPISFAKFP
jgi:hypothetical protein